MFYFTIPNIRHLDLVTSDFDMNSDRTKNISKETKICISHYGNGSAIHTPVCTSLKPIPPEISYQYEIT